MATIRSHDQHRVTVDPLGRRCPPSLRQRRRHRRWHRRPAPNRPTWDGFE